MFRTELDTYTNTSGVPSSLFLLTAVSHSDVCREGGVLGFPKATRESAPIEMEMFYPIRDDQSRDARRKAMFGTRLADAGVDVLKIKELLGHASIVTTMRYMHATDQGKRGAIVVLSEYRQKRRKSLSQRKNGRPNKSLEPAVKFW